MCREELEQGGCDEVIKAEDSVGSKKAVKGDRQLGDERKISQDKAENGSPKKEEKDDGPR